MTASVTIDDVVAEVVGAAGGGLDAGTGGDSREKDLGDSMLSQEFVQGCSMESTWRVLGDAVVGGLGVEAGVEFGEVRREGVDAGWKVGPSGGGGVHGDEDDGEAAAAEGLGEGGGAGDDL